MRDYHKIITICDNSHRKILTINVSSFAKLYFVKNVYHIYKVLIIVSIIWEKYTHMRNLHYTA